MRTMVVPTVGYTGLLVGKLTQHAQWFRLDFSNMCSLNAKVIPPLLRCVRYKNESEEPKLHPRNVQVTMILPSLNATTNLNTEIEITGTERRGPTTEIILGVESRSYVAQEAAVQLWPNAEVDAAVDPADIEDHRSPAD